MISDDDKLAAVERLIEDFRWARKDPAVPEHATYLALKAIATDLRAPKVEAKGRALQSLGFQVDAARAFKARIGYVEVGHMQAMAEALMAHWPAVKKALSREAENEEGKVCG